VRLSRPKKNNAPPEIDRKTFFNQVASSWDEQFVDEDLADFLKQFVPSFGLLAGQNVLDVGTGTGILIPFLHKAVGSRGHITAIDFSQNMVEICKTKYAHLPNVSVKVADAESLDFPDSSFDAVMCFGVFPHLDNKVATLNQFHRVLKSKGKLIIAHALSSAEIKSHHQKAPPAVAHDVLPTEKEMRKLLQQAGFTGIHIIDKQGSYLCTSTKP
jgi:demethylmenaquinone methyltransferase/2-methoxy-6-polyprenyl-1,4-benzoquinol methylase